MSLRIIRGQVRDPITDYRYWAFWMQHRPGQLVVIHHRKSCDDIIDCYHPKTGVYFGSASRIYLRSMKPQLDYVIQTCSRPSLGAPLSPHAAEHAEHICAQLGNIFAGPVTLEEVFEACTTNMVLSELKEAIRWNRLTLADSGARWSDVGDPAADINALLSERTA
jgi:hypothetical protein